MAGVDLYYQRFSAIFLWIIVEQNQNQRSLSIAYDPVFLRPPKIVREENQKSTIMKQLTTNILSTLHIAENKALLEVLKIIAFGSVFPTIYLLGKLVTSL